MIIFGVSKIVFILVITKIWNTYFFEKCILSAILYLSICRQSRMTTTLAGLKTVAFYECSVFFGALLFPEKKLNFTVVPDDINWKQNNWENFCCIV